MKLSSAAFEHEGSIPSKYTCDGENINPPLLISEVSGKAVSLVLIMDDPDVPTYLREDGMWDHWIVFNMPRTLTEIPEDSQPEGVPGSSTRKTLSYGGPCPPDREHRYFFKLYALDTKLDLPEGATKKQVEDAMQDHIIEKAVLMGKYERIQSQAL
jgi:Raf kinase inhibitor-like YbhB/YbcL family protein